MGYGGRIAHCDGDKLKFGKFPSSPANDESEKFLRVFRLRGVLGYALDRVHGIELIEPIVW